MQPNDLDRRREEYLFDPAAEADAAVVELENTMRPFRFDVERHPLALPARMPVRRFGPARVFAAAAAAALALLVLALGFRAWIWSWPDGRPWEVVTSPPGVPESLAEGEALRVGSSDPAVVRIARIGRMRVDPGSEMRLLRTGGTRHRLALERGSISVGVWAPPFSVAIRTPAGMVFDMGCAFELTVVDEVARTRVSSGWVQLENAWGEVLVPEGAAASMRAGRSPSVPVFEDAPESFRRAVRRIEEGAGAAGDLETIRRESRARDVYTLLFLSLRAQDHRGVLLETAARLAPPPSAAVFGRAADGDRRVMYYWVRTLDLPPPKGWVRNWQDAFGP